MDKRFFLRAVAASGTGMALHGCATVGQQPQPGTVVGGTGGVQPGAGSAAAGNGSRVQGVYRPRPFTPDELRQADEARRLMEQGAFGGAGRGGVIVTRQAVDQAWGAVQREMAPFRNTRRVPMEQAVPLALSIADMVRLLELGSRNAPRSSNSRRSQLPPVQVQGSAVVVPPRSKVQFTQRGYCMDSSLPAPGQGEKFTLRPMNQLFPQELLPLYHGLQEQAKTDHRTRRAMQTLVWALREAGTKSRYVHSISRPHLEMMARAYPGGDQLFMRYHQQQYTRNFNPLEELLGRILTVRIDGRTVNLAKMFESNDSRVADDQADRTLEELLNRPVAGEIPRDNSDYTLLQPGVAVKAVGRSQLTPTITVANTTDQPFVFDTKDYYAETQREAQRVGLGAPQNVAHVQDDPMVEPELVRFGSYLEMGLAHLVLDNLARWAMLWALERGSRFTNRLVGSTPSVGGALQLSNLVRGTDWLTEEPLSCTRQAVSAIGTTPGAGAFINATGPNKTTAINKLANSAVSERMITSSERPQFVRSMTDWLSGENARAAVNYVPPPGPVQDSINRVMGGGCQRTWS